MNVREMYRKTKPILVKEISQKLDELNNKDVMEKIENKQILTIASEYISAIDPIVKNIEEFALIAVAENVDLGSEFILRFASDLVSISEKPKSGKIIRFAQGAPAFIAWRILILSSALAIELENYDYAATIIREPIEIEESNGSFSHMPLYKRGRLFYPEAFLGYANYPMQYMANYWTKYEYLHEYFCDLDTYQLSIARILVIIALATSVKEEDRKERQLYPGYRLIPKAKQAISSLCGRMASSEKYRNDIAKVIGDTGVNVKEKWDERAKYLNKADLGHGYFTQIKLPIPMNGDVEEW